MLSVNNVKVNVVKVYIILIIHMGIIRFFFLI